LRESPDEEDPDAKPYLALRSKRLIERSHSMTDVHVYINRPADKEDADLEDLKESLGKLEHVSEVRFDPSGNVVAVSFEGGEAEQEAIERAVEEAGYEVSRISVRSTFSEGPSLWDI
jgi:copper chaperone CopZ